MKKLFFIAAAALTTPSFAFAAEGGSFGWTVTNFSIYAVLAIVLYKKYGAPVLRERAVSIEEHLKRSERELLEAESELAKAMSRLDNLEEEQDEILRKVKEESEVTCRMILSDAKAQSQRINDDMIARIQNEFKSATQNVRNEVVRRTVEIVSQRLSSEVSKEDDKTLRREALSQLF